MGPRAKRFPKTTLVRRRKYSRNLLETSLSLRRQGGVVVAAGEILACRCPMFRISRCATCRSWAPVYGVVLRSLIDSHHGVATRPSERVTVQGIAISVYMGGPAALASSRLVTAYCWFQPMNYKVNCPASREQGGFARRGKVKSRDCGILELSLSFFPILISVKQNKHNEVWNIRVGSRLR